MQKYLAQPARWRLVIALLVAGILALLIWRIWESVTAPLMRLDNLFVEDDPACSLPCWHGIRPGITDAEEAVHILETSPEVRPKSIRHYPASQMFAFDLVVGGVGNLDIRDDTVKSLFLSVDDTTLGAAVELLGAPKWVLVDRGSSGEIDSYTAFLLYPLKGIVIRAGSLAGDQGHSHSIDAAQLYPEMDLHYVGLFPSTQEDSATTVLMEWLSSSDLTGNILDAPEQSWSGYGEYMAARD